MDRSPTRDLLVGIFVLAGLAALAYLSISIGGFEWRPRGQMKLTALFEESGDISVRAPVAIAGVRVGEVTGISLTDDFRAKVEFEVDANLKLPRDTTASIFTAGLLGDRYINLQPGGDDKLLKSGDTITMTERAVILERLLGQLVYGVTKGDKNDEKPDKPGPATAPAKAP